MLFRSLKDVRRSVILRIVGDGPEKASLQDKLRNLPANIEVEFFPYTLEVVDHIDWSDAVFMPSRAELNPVFLHEAWNRGRPALVSDIESFQDLASEGCLITASSSSEYAHAVELITCQKGIRLDAFKSATGTKFEFGLIDRFFRS